MGAGTGDDASEHEHPDTAAKIGNVTIGSIAGEEARQGTEHEHSLSLAEAVKLYPTAVGWSIYFSLGVSLSPCGSGRRMDVAVRD